MGAIRPWIFRILVLIVGGVLVYSWFQPWWTAYVQALDEIAVTIYPSAFVADAGEHPEWLMGAEDAMPGWFFIFMWIYLGVVIAALLFSLFASSEKRVGLGKLKVSLPQALIGGVGLSYIGVCIAAVLTISFKASGFYDAPLQGSIFISFADINESYESWVDTGLQFGFWLACGVGPFLLILAALRNLIAGKS